MSATTDTLAHIQEWVKKHSEPNESINVTPDYFHYKRIKGNRYFELNFQLPLHLFVMMSPSTVNLVMEDILGTTRCEADKK